MNAERLASMVADPLEKNDTDGLKQALNRSVGLTVRFTFNPEADREGEIGIWNGEALVQEAQSEGQGVYRLFQEAGAHVAVRPIFNAAGKQLGVVYERQPTSHLLGLEPGSLAGTLVTATGFTRRLRGFLGTYSDIEVIAEAESGRKAVELACELVPDVILMDLLMPEMNGVEAIDRIMAVSPATYIIVLTSYADDESLFPAIRAGALGQATLHPAVAARLVKGADHTGDGPQTDLSERELDVLRLIARGLSNREIAETLFVAEGTVKSHVSNILSKLNLAHRTQAALYALKRKLARLEDLPPDNGQMPG